MRANTWDEEVAVLPVAALLIISIVAGLIAWAIAGPVLRRPARKQPTSAVADEVRAHTAVRRFVHSRLDTEVLTGLALTLAVFMLCLAGVVIALLVVLIHHSEPLADLDKGAARWAQHHSGAATHRFLDAVTTLASTRGVIVIAVDRRRRRVDPRAEPLDPRVPAGRDAGDSVVTTTIKGIVDRSRPTIDPLAAHLGPSFPSGHSSTAAALFAALALLAGRRRSPARERPWSGSPSGWPSRSPAAACCSTCTGYPTSLPGWRLDGPGSRSARSRLVAGRCAWGRSSSRQAPREARNRLSARPVPRAPERSRAGRRRAPWCAEAAAGRRARARRGRS